MGDTLKKVQRGQKLHVPAAAYNAFIDAARDQQARQRSSEQSAQAAARSSGLVLVKNASGADRGRFDVLGVDGPVFGPADNPDGFRNKLALRGVTPTSDHAGRFVILQEPLKAGAIGHAIAGGVSIVKIDVQAEGDRMADAADGAAGNLISGGSGVAQVLWKEPGTGVRWAVVRLGGGGVPAGVRQYQVLQMVADNVVGWDWVRAHPV